MRWRGIDNYTRLFTDPTFLTALGNTFIIGLIAHIPILGGGLVLLELSAVGDPPEAAIRALVSRPNYDSNALAEQFETLADDESGPLFDRASQGLYQPGLIVQPFLTAAAPPGAHCPAFAFPATIASARARQPG